MRIWFRNVYRAVVTVLYALWVCLRYWFRTYDPKRRTFTEHYEYPELPAKISPRFRGFHRYDLTTCIACERCAPGMSGRVHSDWEAASGRPQGLPNHQLHDRLRKVPVLRDLHAVLPGGLHFHGQGV